MSTLGAFALPGFEVNMRRFVFLVVVFVSGCSVYPDRPHLPHYVCEKSGPHWVPCERR